MIIVKSLEAFNNIIDITSSGDYEAHCKDGKLVASTKMSFGAVFASLNGIAGLDFYTNCRTLNKHLGFFDSPNVEISTSENAIFLSDAKMDIVLPMVEKSAAEKNTPKIPPVFPTDISIVIPAIDLKKAIKIAKDKALDESVIKFVIDNGLKIVVGKKIALKISEVVGQKNTWGFVTNTLDTMFAFSQGDIKIGLHYPIEKEIQGQKIMGTDLPCTFEYSTGQIQVRGFFMQCNSEN